MIILILISIILLDHSRLTLIVGTRLKVKGEHWEGERRGKRRRVKESQISSSYHPCSPFWVSYLSFWVSFFSFSDSFSSYRIKSGVALASRWNLPSDYKLTYKTLPSLLLSSPTNFPQAVGKEICNNEKLIWYHWTFLDQKRSWLNQFFKGFLFSRLAWKKSFWRTDSTSCNLYSN